MLDNVDILHRPTNAAASFIRTSNGMFATVEVRSKRILIAPGATPTAVWSVEIEPTIEDTGSVFDAFRLMHRRTGVYMCATDGILTTEPSAEVATLFSVSLLPTGTPQLCNASGDAVSLPGIDGPLALLVSGSQARPPRFRGASPQEPAHARTLSSSTPTLGPLAELRPIPPLGLASALQAAELVAPESATMAMGAPTIQAPSPSDPKLAATIAVTTAMEQTFSYDPARLYFRLVRCSDNAALSLHRPAAPQTGATGLAFVDSDASAAVEGASAFTLFDMADGTAQLRCVANQMAVVADATSAATAVRMTSPAFASAVSSFRVVKFAVPLSRGTAPASPSAANGVDGGDAEVRTVERCLLLSPAGVPLVICGETVVGLAPLTDAEMRVAVGLNEPLPAAAAGAADEGTASAGPARTMSVTAKGPATFTRLPNGLVQCSMIFSVDELRALLAEATVGDAVDE